MIFAAQRLCDDIKLSVGRRFIVGGGHSAALISRLSTYHEYVAVAWRYTSEGGLVRAAIVVVTTVSRVEWCCRAQFAAMYFLCCLMLPLIECTPAHVFSDIRNARGYRGTFVISMYLISCLCCNSRIRRWHMGNFCCSSLLRILTARDCAQLYTIQFVRSLCHFLFKLSLLL